MIIIAPITYFRSKSNIANNWKALGLNTDLIEAIALGHDVGHTPLLMLVRKFK